MDFYLVNDEFVFIIFLSILLFRVSFLFLFLKKVAITKPGFELGGL